MRNEAMDPVLDALIGTIKSPENFTYALRDLVLNTVAAGTITAIDALNSVEVALQDIQSVAKDAAAAWKESDEATL